MGITAYAVFTSTSTSSAPAHDLQFSFTAISLVCSKAKLPGSSAVAASCSHGQCRLQLTAHRSLLLPVVFVLQQAQCSLPNLFAGITHAVMIAQQDRLVSCALLRTAHQPSLALSVTFGFGILVSLLALDIYALCVLMHKSLHCDTATFW